MDKTSIKRRSALIKGVSIMKAMEKEISRTCPDCTSQLTYSIIGINELALLCVNSLCEFPFNRMPLETVSVKFTDDCDDTISSLTCKSSNVPIDATQSVLEMEQIRQELNRLKLLHEDSEVEKTGTGVWSGIDPVSYENPPRNEIIEKIGVTNQHLATISDSFFKTCPVCKWELETVTVDYDKITVCCANEGCSFPIGYLEFDQIFVNVRKEFKPRNPKSEMRLELMILDKQLKRTQVNDSGKSLENDLKELMKIDNRYKNVLHRKYDTECNSNSMIKNKSWLRRLASIQKSTKEKLVTSEEMKLLRRSPENNVNLVRVDISGGIPAFRIDIVNGDGEAAVIN